MISALERLRALRAGKSLEVIDVDAIPMEWRYEYEERAAIYEYDAGFSREEADRMAFKDICDQLGLTLNRGGQHE
jgi:hypothetical protein